jgi:hypothetical protein
MFTPVRVAVLIILLLILAFSAWSKLRFLDQNSNQPQRWRVEEFPRLQQTPVQAD